MREDNEPSLEELDDYNGKESPEKRRMIWLVVLIALAIGVIFAMLGTNSPRDDLIRTTPKSDTK